MVVHVSNSCMLEPEVGRTLRPTWSIWHFSGPVFKKKSIEKYLKKLSQSKNL